MKFFRFGSSTPPPPPPPARPPRPPLARPQAAKPPARPPIPVARPSIVGRWQERGSKEATEFRADGTLLERLGNGEMINGRYVLEGARLQIELQDVGPLSFSVSLNAETLELTDAEGQVTRYRRL
ncbi:MAG: DUF5640 domain-containing protein [Verrucomicrobiota bacterium]|nr:DUF5640 domain-containing protein [Verrucomicrobiota bacterium]